MTEGKCQRVSERFTLPAAAQTGGQRRLFSHLSHQRNGSGVGFGASRGGTDGNGVSARNPFPLVGEAGQPRVAPLDAALTTEGMGRGVTDERKTLL